MLILWLRGLRWAKIFISFQLLCFDVLILHVPLFLRKMIIQQVQNKSDFECFLFSIWKTTIACMESVFIQGARVLGCNRKWTVPRVLSSSCFPACLRHKEAFAEEKGTFAIRGSLCRLCHEDMTVLGQFCS